MTAPAAHRRLGRAAIAAATAALAALTGSPAVAANADAAVKPSGGVITIAGAGWGHGHGMSQYGAKAAAQQGLSYSAILGFYYPGTSLTKAGASTIRVWISADDDGSLAWRPEAGLRVSDSGGTTVSLPTGTTYKKWRIARSGSTRVLAYRDPSGKYHRYTTALSPTKVWSVENTSTGTVKLAMPDGTTRLYYGKMVLRFTTSGARTVNYLPMEQYLRTVVPAEMPASWPTEAVKAQAVAARTYAASERQQMQAAGATYDICDTSACQVYGTVSTWENAAATKAITATAGTVVSYRGKPALTQFSSSDGGWVAASDGYPYLVAKKDPYEKVSYWSTTVTSAAVQKAFPSIGTLMSVTVAKRDGNGTWGGRVEQLLVAGSKTTLTVSGTAFRSKLGLRGTLFTIRSGKVSTAVATNGAGG